MRRSIRVGLSPYLEGSQRGAELPRRITVTPNSLLYDYSLRQKTLRGLLKRVVLFQYFVFYERLRLDIYILLLKQEHLRRYPLAEMSTIAGDVRWGSHKR